ncbi:hypothetical protein BDP67DRAFT_531453, partial [Colletotrichum lupini]
MRRSACVFLLCRVLARGNLAEMKGNGWSAGVTCGYGSFVNRIKIAHADAIPLAYLVTKDSGIPLQQNGAAGRLKTFQLKLIVVWNPRHI